MQAKPDTPFIHVFHTECCPVRGSIISDCPKAIFCFASELQNLIAGLVVICQEQFFPAVPFKLNRVMAQVNFHYLPETDFFIPVLPNIDQDCSRSDQCASRP